jgi:hypothetical protein
VPWPSYPVDLIFHDQQQQLELGLQQERRHTLSQLLSDLR